MEAKEFIELRKSLGLSQVDLAKEFGISSKQISNMETGFSEIKEIYAKKLLDMSVVCKAIAIHTTPDIIQIPYYKDCHLAAGNGCLNHDSEIATLTISKEALKGVSNYKNLEAVNITGQSMSPYINHGDVVIIQKGAPVMDGLVYAFRYGDEYFCKRLEIDPISREIHVKSDNPSVSAFSVRDEDLENIQIIGRVVGRFGAVV